MTPRGKDAVVDEAEWLLENLVTKHDSTSTGFTLHTTAAR